jgi:hypothetical protein
MAIGRAVGIDWEQHIRPLAVVDEYGKPDRLEERAMARARLRPQCFFDEPNYVVGETALQKHDHGPRNKVVQFVKRFMGPRPGYRVHVADRRLLAAVCLRS